MGDYINDLNGLSVEVREGLNDWLALRKVEFRGPLKVRADDAYLAEKMSALVDRGDVSRTRVRHRLFWTREAFELSDVGRRRLEAKRRELEEVHDEIGMAIATATEALAERGIHPGVLLLERMILLHRRFDREEDGFFTRCERLAAHVRSFSAPSESVGEGGEWLALWALNG